MRLAVLVFLALVVGQTFSAHEGLILPTVVLEPQGPKESAPHRQGNIYAPCVLIESGQYKMWYGGQGQDGHDRIFYAESADGRTWNRKGVVLDNAGANHVNDPSVVKVGETYFQYYSRTEIDVIDRIDLATSTDGLNWQTHGVVVGPSGNGDWESLSVGRPAVIVDDGVFKMWYDGRKDFPPGSPVKNVPKSPDSRRYVGYATSTDGFVWKRHAANPVFANDAGAVDVQKVGATYVMLYESGAGTRLAASPDGIQWDDRGLFLLKSSTPIDAFGHVTPFMLYEPNQPTCQIFVGAATAATWDQQPHRRDRGTKGKVA